MTKLLVNSPQGIQQIIEVGEGGGYFDSARVLWDERADGALPAITLGGMKRVSGALVFDANLLAADKAIRVSTDSARKILQTKVEAQRRIYVLAPQWKQANLTARMVELHQKRLDLVLLTAAEQAEVTASQALWDKVKAVRAASDLIEADIQAAVDPSNFDVVNSPRWPV